MTEDVPQARYGLVASATNLPGKIGKTVTINWLPCGSEGLLSSTKCSFKSKQNPRILNCLPISWT